jgi:23S rRNA (uracil1939-C5)-methyltransferase
VAESAQRAAKQGFVERALGKLEVPVAPIVAAPAGLGYRVRATMHTRGGVLGFHARRSHALVAVEHCPALEPGLDAALQAARGLPLGEDGVLRGTVIAGGGGVAGGAVQLAIEPGRGADPRVIADAAASLVGTSGIAGVVISNAGGAGEREIVFGAALLDAGEPGAPFFVSAAGFRQANHAQNDRLRALVRDALSADGARVLELYAGDGNFTRDLGAAVRIIAVEEDAAAVARLRRNVPRAEPHVGRVERVLRALPLRAGDVDRILIDPPRAGAKEAMPTIARLGAERVVYVSCDPATLARDAAMLRAGGYRLVSATPIDLMPHTDHVETLLLATRE